MVTLGCSRAEEGRGPRGSGGTPAAVTEVHPPWAKLIDFETTLPSAVEELGRQREGRTAVPERRH
jgi:hypothetical protein